MLSICVEDSTKSVQELVDGWLAKRRGVKECDKCEQICEYRAETTVIKAPEILIVHLRYPEDIDGLHNLLEANEVDGLTDLH